MATPPGNSDKGQADDARNVPQRPKTPPAAEAKPSSRKPRQRKTAPKATEGGNPPPPTIAPAPPPGVGPVAFSPRALVPQPFQPYPGPQFHIMNPGYPSPPMNGSPYPPPPGQAAHPPPYPHHGSPIPQPYGYPPMHHGPSPYAHGYPPYQYPPQQMMMYGIPRPSPQESPHPASPAPAQASGSKRKRTSDSGPKEDESEEENTTPQAQQTAAAAAAEMKKRTKTQRACDSCRSRKIRCDVLQDADPPVCQHCKQYGFECTFFLPITETRFKKKRAEPAEEEKTHTTPSAEVKRDVGVFGPTSTAHLLHSTATISSRMYESYDLRYQHTWEVSKNGDGLIIVERPHTDENQVASTPKSPEMRLERDIVERLLNAYFTQIAPLLPVITQAEFVSTPDKAPPPILLYSMCLAAAARREVPQTVFDSIRHAVNNVIKAEDVLSTASLVNVQSLLILCMTGDCHSQFVPNALSALWIRLGVAIRMAQDLGLHRAESVRHQIELRRRLWGACVISDRWTSLTYGHPFMIDVQDCDVRLPSSGDPNDLYMDELVRLSVILGRVLKTIYSPSGLTLTTDEMLIDLLESLESWKRRLPEHLQYRGPDSPRNAGLLHLLYACVSMIFWRVFMRISYLCPVHLKFSLTVEQWTNLVQLTGEAIDWLDKHENMYDVWLIVAYAATSCALVQYHTWARRKDEGAAAKLRKLSDCVRRWTDSLSPDHMSARRKTAEIINLLYEATKGPPPAMEAPALNPTGGVTGKTPMKLTYKKDPSRPGGGVFIAESPTRAEDIQDIPSGVILREEESNEEAGEKASATADATKRRRREKLDREFLLSSSAFAPPLPGDESSNKDSPTATTSAGGQTPSSSTQMVNFSPLVRQGSANINVNPAMNADLSSGNVQVMNLLDSAQAPQSFEQFAALDNLLDGMPGGMFDWGQWATYFGKGAPQPEQNSEG